MGTAAFRGKGFKERARVSGESPIGAASFRQQSIQESCQPPRFPSAPSVPEWESFCAVPLVQQHFPRAVAACQSRPTKLLLSSHGWTVFCISGRDAGKGGGSFPLRQQPPPSLVGLYARLLRDALAFWAAAPETRGWGSGPSLNAVPGPHGSVTRRG